MTTYQGFLQHHSRCRDDRWFEAFRREPDQAVADLISGRAGVGSNLGLDLPELLYQIFPLNLVEERAQLDGALVSWLLRMRKDHAEQVKRLGLPAYGKRVGDVLIALQLLDLPEARVLGEALDRFLEHTQEQAAKKLADTLRTSWLAEPDRS